MNKAKITEIKGRQIGVLLTTGLFPPEVGGPATYSFLLSEGLPEYGFFVRVLPFSRVKNLPKVIRHIVFFFLCFKEAYGMDILYAQDTVSVGYPTSLVAKILRKKFVVRVAGDHAWEQARGRFGVKDTLDDFQKNRKGHRVSFLHWIQKKTTLAADKIIVPSAYFRGVVSVWVPNPSKIIVIYNGIDLSVAPEGKPYRDREKIILSAGRLVPWKGFEVLIRAISKMAGWKLYIAGDGPEKEALTRIVRDHSLEEKVKFLGNISRNQLFNKMTEARIFILNSSFESFSFQTVEAMHAGLPVIVTTAGSLPEIVEDKKEGVLITPDDEKAIVEAATRIDNYDEVREGFIGEAKKKSGRFSVEKTLDKLSEVLRDVIED